MTAATAEHCKLHNEPYPCPACSREFQLTEVTQLVPRPTEAELARELRQALADALGPALLVCTRAFQAGLTPQFSVGPDARGIYGIADIKFIKTY